MTLFLKKFQSVFFILIIIAVGWICYGHTLNYSFHFDDEFYIIKNPVIRHLTDIKAMWKYDKARTLGYFSFALNYAWHQFQLPKWHMTNISIHIIAAIAAFWLAILLLLTPKMKDSFLSRHRHLIGLFVGILFVCHPIQTQAVTYLWQRVASMATMFYLLSLGCYLKGRLTNNKIIYFVGAVVLALAAFFTKENSGTLPIVILVIEMFFFQVAWRQLIRSKLFFILLIAFLIVPILAHKNIISFLTLKSSSESFDGEIINGHNYRLSQCRVLWTYIKLLFVPIGQNLDYEYRVSKSFFEWKTFLGFWGLCLIFFAGFKLFKNYRLLSFGVLWFFLTIFIEAGAFPIDCLIYEHRVYLPFFGFSLFFIGGWFTVFQRKYFKRSLLALILILASYSYLTIERNKVWENDYTLWRDIVKKTPHKLRAFNNLGKVLAEMKRHEEAIEQFNRGLAINPERIELLINRGISYENLGKYKEAFADFDKVIEISKNPQGYSNRAYLFYRMGDLDSALKDFSAAIEKNPNHLQALLNRGIIFFKQKRYVQALEDFSKAIKLDPFYYPSYNNRGNVYLKTGKFKEAIEDFSKTIEFMPYAISAYQNRAEAYFQTGDFSSALADIEKVLKVHRGNKAAYYQRGIIQFKNKKHKEAWEDFSKAKELGYPVPKKLFEQLEGFLNKEKIP